jgi:hypothetical protein
MGPFCLPPRQPTLHFRVNPLLISGKSTTDHSDIFQVDLSGLLAEDSQKSKGVARSVSKDNDTKSTKTRTESIGSEDHLHRYCMRLPCSTTIANRTPNSRRRKPAVAFCQGLLATFGGFDGEEFYSEMQSVFLKEPASVVLGEEKTLKEPEAIGELDQDPRPRSRAETGWFDSGFCVEGRWIGCHWYSLSLCFKDDNCEFLDSLRSAPFQIVSRFDFRTVQGFLHALLNKQFFKWKKKYIEIAEYFEIKSEDVIEEPSNEELLSRLSSINCPNSVKVQVCDQEPILNLDINLLKKASRFFEQLDSWRQWNPANRDEVINVPSGFIDYLLRVYRRDQPFASLQSRLNAFHLCDYLLDGRTKQVSSRLRVGIASGNLREHGWPVGAVRLEPSGDLLGQEVGSGRFVLPSATVGLASNSFRGDELSSLVEEFLPPDRLGDWQAVEGFLLASFAGMVYLAKME